MKSEEKFKDYINMYISSYMSLAIIILIGYALSRCIINDLDYEYISSNYIYTIKLFVSENSERMIYIVSTVMFPLLYVLFYKLLQKVNIEIKNYKLIFNISSILNVVILIALFLWIGIYPKTNIILFILLLISIVIATIFIKHYKKLTKYIIYILTGIMIAIISYLYINPTFEQCKYLSYHMDAYYYPILKISNGLTPYIDFSPIYGCYSYIFVLIQNIFNNDSLLFFSIIEAILVAISLTNFSVVIYKVIKNKIIGLVTFLALVFPITIFSFVKNNGPYIQYMPHRVLFISIFILFIVKYLKKTDNKKYFKLLGFTISALALFWNIETGLIILIAWNAILAYEILFFNSLKNKKIYLDISKMIIYDIIVIGMLIVSIITISYIRTGEILDISNMISSQTLFYGSGFNMLRMPLCYPWIIVVLSYIIGLIVSIKKIYLINKSNSKILFMKYGIIFALSIIGIGIFSYYQGRSHSEVFKTILYPAIILGGIYADILLRQIKFSKQKIIKISRIALYIIIIGTLTMYVTLTIHDLLLNDNVYLYMDKNKMSSCKKALIDFSEYDVQNMEFIIPNESLYYKQYSLKDTKRLPAFVDIFTYDDCKKIIQFLKETEKNVVIYEPLYKLICKDNEFDSIKGKFRKEKIREEKYEGIILILNQN